MKTASKIYITLLILSVLNIAIEFIIFDFPWRPYGQISCGIMIGLVFIGFLHFLWSGKSLLSDND